MEAVTITLDGVAVSGYSGMTILDLAREHDVPVQENSELTALLAQVELGEEIPAELYLAVAQVIAFAYQVSGKTLPTTSDED